NQEADAQIGAPSGGVASPGPLSMAPPRWTKVPAILGGQQRIDEVAFSWGSPSGSTDPPAEAPARPRLPEPGRAARGVALLVVLVFGPQERAAQGLALDVALGAGALALLLLGQGLIGFCHADARHALDAIEFPGLLPLLGSAGIGGLAVGLGAAAKSQEV